MRIIRVILPFAVLILLMAGCTSDDTSSGTFLELPEASYTLDASITEQEITMNGDGNWSAHCNVGWCAPWKNSGTKGDKLTLWVSPNLTSTIRTGQLTVSSGAITKTVTLTQPAFTGVLDDYTYRMPVVFHILYKDKSDEKQYVKASRIEDIISKVNRLYDYNDINISFELAKYDENGNALSEQGIMRHQVDWEEFNSNTFLSYDDTAKPYAEYNQNVQKFINIFLFKFEQDEEGSSRMGISPLPLLPSAYPLDSLNTQNGLEIITNPGLPWGCCINNEFIYDESSQYYVSTDVIVTIAHELGHYLGLHHTFSDDGCSKDDACDDTPLSDYDNYIEWVKGYIDDKKKEEGEGATLSLRELATRQECHTDTAFVADNVMDYAFCYSDKFTKQQNARMRHVLYYAPMVCGPKLNSATRSNQGPHPTKLPVVTSRCPWWKAILDE